MQVFEEKAVGKYLKKHPVILAQYKKARDFLESEEFDLIFFKKRKPKSENIYQFRISKKYRAFGSFRNADFIVFEINDHQ